MKHPYSQAELQQFASNGQTIIVGYRSAAEIKASHGAGQYILSPLPPKPSGLPYTQRGRVQALTPEHFERVRLH